MEENTQKRYGYYGSYFPEEAGYNEYRPETPSELIYMNVYPGELGKDNKYKYGESMKRVRVVKNIDGTVNISGYSDKFSVVQHNKSFYRLENTPKKPEDKICILVRKEDAQKHKICLTKEF